MNIKDELTCKYCKQIYQSPITLNCCGENICKQHIDELISNSNSSSIRFTCLLCFEENVNQKLNVNKFMQKMLESDLHKLQTDSKYKQVLEDLKKEFQNLEAIVKDPENVIYEEIGELKRQVDLDREKSKIEIDKLADDLIQQLESYETRLKAEYKAHIKYYSDLLELSKKQLVDYEKCLNMFSVSNEEKDIKSKENENFIIRLKPKIKELKDKLFSNLSIKYEPMKNNMKEFFGKLLIIKVSF